MILPLCNTDEAGDDDGGGDRGEDESEHEADGEREAHDEVGQGGHGRGLHEAGDEGGPQDHPTEVPQGHGVHLEAGSDEDHGQTERPQLPRNQGIQLMSDVLGMTIRYIIRKILFRIINNGFLLNASLKSGDWWFFIVDDGLKLHNFLEKVLWDASFEWSMFIYRIKLMNAVNKSVIMTIRSALSSSKLSDVVGNILQDNSHQKHSLTQKWVWSAVNC